MRREGHGGRVRAGGWGRSRENILAREGEIKTARGCGVVVFLLVTDGEEMEIQGDRLTR